MPPSPREPFLACALARPESAEARQRIQEWARATGSRLGELGYSTGQGVGRAQPGGRSTLVVLARRARGREQAAASISLFIDDSHVEVAVDLPPADASAARARIADPVRALELTTAFEALPEQFAIGVAGDGGRAPASRASTDQIRALLDRADHEQRSLWLGWSIPRDVAMTHADLLDEQLEDAVVALGSVLALLALPPGRLAPAPRERAASWRRGERDGSRSDDERPGAKRRARARDDSTAPARSGHGQYPEQRERDSENAAEPEAREHDGASSPRQPRGGASAKAPARAGVRARRSRNPDANRPIEKGSRVRVLDGPFCGKVGVVQELDGKGAARVMLGLLAVRVEVGHLARSTEGGTRPLLSSSHRKPVPVRS